MTVAAICLVGMVAGLAVRLVGLALYRRWFTQGLAGDMSIHYTIIRQLRSHPRSRWIDQYLISFEPMSYPTAFHRFAMLFPQRLLRARPYLPNLVLFAVSAPCFLIYARYLQSEIGTTSAMYLAIAAIVFLVSTSNFVFQGPAIAYLSLSERLMGRLTCSAAFLFLLGYQQTGNRPSLWLAIVASTLAILSSVFARQALIFSSPILSLVWWTPVPVLVVVGSFGVGLIISRSHLTASMKHTVIQWKLYATHTKRSRLQRGTLSYFVRPRHLWESRRQPKAVAEELVRREPSRSLLMYPEFWLLGVLLIVQRHEVGRTVTGELVAAGVVYLATSTDWLNHLGESYRYLEYELTFAVPLLVAQLCTGLSRSSVILLFGLYGVAVLAATALWVFVIPRFSRAIHRDELSDFMDDIDKPPGTVVFPVPMLIAGDICARYEQCKSFWWQPGMMTVKIYDVFFEEFPFLKRDYSGLFETYGVNLVICKKDQLKFVDWDYDFSGLDLIKEDPNYLAYRVPMEASR